MYFSHKTPTAALKSVIAFNERCVQVITEILFSLLCRTMTVCITLLFLVIVSHFSVGTRDKVGRTNQKTDILKQPNQLSRCSINNKQ